MHALVRARTADSTMLIINIVNPSFMYEVAPLSTIQDAFGCIAENFYLARPCFGL
jgi:hypothetical protein